MNFWRKLSRLLFVLFMYIIIASMLSIIIIAITYGLYNLGII